MVALPCCVASQNTFQKAYGLTAVDYGYSLDATTDSGYVITGYITYGLNEGKMDIYLIKLDRYGDTIWAKSFGGNENEQGYSVKQTPDGGFIVVGSTTSFGLANPGTPDIYVIKTDSIGDTLWTKAYGGNDFDEAYDVWLVSDGGYIITGQTKSFGAGFQDIFLLKIDNIGNIVWSKTIGSTGADVGYAIRQTQDGGFVVSGIVGGFGAGNLDVYLVKTDSLGDTLWTKTYGGGGNEWGYDVQQTSDSGFIIVGATNSFGSGGEDVYLIKTDDIGNVIWTKTYGQILDINQDGGRSVKQTNDGGFIITGYTTVNQFAWEDVYLVKTDDIGNVIWSKGYNVSFDNSTYQVLETPEKDYVLVGYSELGIYVVKTDSSGNTNCVNNQYEAPAFSSSTATLTGSGGVVDTAIFVQNSTATLVRNPINVIEDVCDTTIGIKEQLTINNEITVYPNPVRDEFAVELDFKGKVNIELYDMMGQVVLREKGKGGKYTINAGNLRAGVYFLQVSWYNRVTREKIVKQ